MGMTEQQDRLALEREEITARVATFKATQEKFQRDRDAYCAATLEAARAIKRNRLAEAELRRRAIEIMDSADLVGSADLTPTENLSDASSDQVELPGPVLVS